MALFAIEEDVISGFGFGYIRNTMISSLWVLMSLAPITKQALFTSVNIFQWSFRTKRKERIKSSLSFSPPVWRCRWQACGHWRCTPCCWCTAPVWLSEGTPHRPPSATLSLHPDQPSFRLSRPGAGLCVAAATESCRSRQVYVSYCCRVDKHDGETEML